MDDKQRAQLQQDWQAIDGFIEGAKHFASTREIAAVRNAFERTAAVITQLVQDKADAEKAIAAAHAELVALTEKPANPQE